MLLSEQDETIADELRDIFDDPDDNGVKEVEEEESLEREWDAEEAGHEAELRVEQDTADVARQEEYSLVVRHNLPTESVRETCRLRRVSMDIH